MRAVFLHVLADALGSLIVIISALLIKFIDADWKYKIDPALRYFIIHRLSVFSAIFQYSLYYNGIIKN